MAFAALETDRLRLRRLAEADLPALLAYRNDPPVARCQSWDGFTPEEARASLEGQLRTEPGTPGMLVPVRPGGAGHRDRGGRRRPARPRRRAAPGRDRLHPDPRAPGPRAGRRGGAPHPGLRLRHAGAAPDHRDDRLRERGLGGAAGAPGLRREGHFLQNVWFKGRWGDEFPYALLRSEWRGGPRSPGPARRSGTDPAADPTPHPLRTGP